MQIQTTGSMIEACLVISQEEHEELIKSFGDRLRGQINYAKCVCRNQGGISYEEANQAYWTSYETKDALHSDVIEAFDAITKCRSARASLLRVIQASE